MAKDGERETGYVRKVQEDTRRYVEKLLKENETLRTVLVKTESEKRLRSRRRAAGALAVRPGAR